MFRLFSTILITHLLLAPLTKPAARAADSLWMHNGSLMRYHAEGEARMFLYEAPRTALAPLKDRILFYGWKDKDTLFGLARLFRKGCPPVSYPVRGHVQGATRIVLFGALPDRGRSGCAVRRWRADGPGSRLVFTYQQRVRAVPVNVPEDVVADFEAVLERPYIKKGFDIPGGEILVTAPDYVAPASNPINIFVEARCTGRRPAMLRRFLACALKEARRDPASGDLLLTTLPYDPATATCGAARWERMSVTGVCE